MVMHTRKLPRINDGFSDKHQSHNAYESSKYGSGSKYRGGSQVAFAGPDKRDSPSANSLRSSSPDSRSQSPRYHKSSSSNYYKREREYSSREHRDTRDGSRSPKDRRRDRYTEHSSRSSSMKKEGAFRIGDWSEHVSSNGKRYYYNCKSEKSQWEKPQDWLDWELQQQNSSSRHKQLTSHYNNSKPSYSSSSVNSNKVSSYNSIGLSSQYNSSKGGGGGNYTSYSNNSKNNSFITPTSSNSKVSNNVISSSHHHHTSHHHHPNNISSNSKERNSSVLQEKSKLDKHSNMDNRDHHYRDEHHYDKRKFTGQDMEISSGGSTPTSDNRLVGERHKNNSGGLNSRNTHQNSNSVVSDPRHHHLHYNSELSPLNSTQQHTGPPTPTHSESHDHLDIRKGESSLSRLTGNGSNNNCNNAMGGVPSLSSSLSSSLTCQRPLHPPPALTPSLAKFYKESLISHVKDWPAENIEKQCQRLSEEVHTQGSIVMTKVSADLKMARSLVRLAEIQATLHEQRVLFLRAQKTELDEVGVRSQNTFMKDTQGTSNNNNHHHTS